MKLNNKISVLVVGAVILVIIAGAWFGGHTLGKRSKIVVKDPKISLSSISTVGKLDVLSASVSIKQSLSAGSESDPDYVSLYELKGNAVFSIDFDKMKVNVASDESKEIWIKLPTPSLELYVDETTRDKIAEYQKHSWSGSAETGYRAYFESNAATVRDMKELILNYDYLLNSAKESAKKQLLMLVNSTMAGEKYSVSVFFEEEK